MSSHMDQQVNMQILLLGLIIITNLVTCDGQECDSVLTGSGVIKSKGHPGSYPSNFDCEWIIEARDYDTVNLKFMDFNIEPGDSCEFDSITITAKGRDQKFCGDNMSRLPNNGSLRLEGRVSLRMITDESVNLRGISLQYQVVPGEPPPTTPPPTTTPVTTPSPGTTCDDKPCLNGADCEMLSPTEFFCFCPDGFEGNLCEINIDDCASNPCENGGTCIDGIESWDCECVTGYVGKTCGIDYNECRSEPCQNGATCEDRVGAYNCICARGWTGGDCSTDIDECSPNPCRNYGVCEDHLGYHTCICHPKYTGPNCTVAIETTTTEQTYAVTTTQPTEETTTAHPTTTLSPYTTPMEMEELITINSMEDASPLQSVTIDQNQESLTTLPAVTETGVIARLDSATTLSNNPKNENESKSPIRLDLLLGIIGGVVLVVGISLSVLCFYLKALSPASKIFPTAPSKGSKQKMSVGDTTISPTSTDSGIFPDTDGRIVGSTVTSNEAKLPDRVQNNNMLGSAQSEDMKADENVNHANGVVNGLPRLFSPRPSPIASPMALPPLKEEIKPKQEGQITANLSPSTISPSTYQNFIPAATVFTFSNHTTAGTIEPRSKRKRKLAYKARGPRPKTAALATKQLQSDPLTANNQSKPSTTLSFEKRLQANAVGVNGSTYPLQLPENNKALGFHRPLTVGAHPRTYKHLNSSTKESDSKNKSSSSEINFEKPPLFLSQLHKKPQPEFSLIERSSIPAGTSEATAAHNLWSSCRTQEQTQPHTMPTLAPSYQNTEFSNKSIVVTPPANSLPAHSIEEAFESRNPRAFSLHRRRRLSPINYINDQHQDPHHH